MPTINRDTDYAVRALMQLAQKRAVTAVSELAEAEKVPADFLRKIMQKLHRAGFLASEQGPSGGYRLRKSPEKIRLLEVAQTVQGPVLVSRCLADPDVCTKAPACPLRRRLSALQANLDAWLADITLADMMEPVAQQEVRRSDKV